MNKLNKLLLMLIAMLAIMILAASIDRGYDYFQARKWEKERVEAYEQAKAEIESIQMKIETLSADPEALTAYIEENELHYVEVVEEDSENAASGNALSENTVSENAVSENMMSGNTVLGNTVSENMVSGNTVPENTVSGNTVSGNMVSENAVSGNTVSGNTISGNSVSGNTVSDNSISGNASATMQICASYEETIRINKLDKQTIAANQIDFSDLKIACLGDSITAATNLNKQENYEQYAYPQQLKEILNAEEAVNLGIGGSSIGRYWENAFVDRYREIPADTDLIIVMGGTNDGFCATEKELGSLEEREKGTFAGDLDELLKGLKEEYPEAVIVLSTPLANVLHDMLRKSNENLLSQSEFVKIMTALAKEHEVPVIDLYSSRILDTHDAAVIHNFMPDGVHGNQAGYRILAEHMAAELIKLYEGMEE